MERSERDQLEQICKDVMREEVLEILTNYLSANEGSRIKGENQAHEKIDALAEAMVNRWIRDTNGKTNKDTL